MAIANGTCDRLIIGGNDRSDACTGKLLNTIYLTGRVGFYFVTDNGAALTFTGLGDRQVKPDPDTAVQPIDGIIFGYGGKTDRAKAVGSCRFTNPYQKPGIVQCRADTPNGQFEASFRTDGNPPSVTRPR
ncbi:MAG: protein of unassigned function [Methylobacterium brachiatum]|nr:protein of unassigned function [Methylobacterium brachiatum]